MKWSQKYIWEAILVSLYLALPVISKLDCPTCPCPWYENITASVIQQTANDGCSTICSTNQDCLACCNGCCSDDITSCFGWSWSQPLGCLPENYTTQRSMAMYQVDGYHTLCHNFFTGHETGEACPKCPCLHQGDDGNSISFSSPASTTTKKETTPQKLTSCKPCQCPDGQIQVKPGHGLHHLALQDCGPLCRNDSSCLDCCDQCCFKEYQSCMGFAWSKPLGCMKAQASLRALGVFEIEGIHAMCNEITHEHNNPDYVCPLCECETTTTTVELTTTETIASSTPSTVSKYKACPFCDCSNGGNGDIQPSLTGFQIHQNCDVACQGSLQCMNCCDGCCVDDNTICDGFHWSTSLGCQKGLRTKSNSFTVPGLHIICSNLTHSVVPIESECPTCTCPQSTSTTELDTTTTTTETSEPLCEPCVCNENEIAQASAPQIQDNSCNAVCNGSVSCIDCCNDCCSSNANICKGFAWSEALGCLKQSKSVIQVQGIMGVCNSLTIASAPASCPICSCSPIEAPFSTTSRQETPSTTITTTTSTTATTTITRAATATTTTATTRMTSTSTTSETTATTTTGCPCPCLEIFESQCNSVCQQDEKCLTCCHSCCLNNSEVCVGFAFSEILGCLKSDGVQKLKTINMVPGIHALCYKLPSDCSCECGKSTSTPTQTTTQTFVTKPPVQYSPVCLSCPSIMQKPSPCNTCDESLASIDQEEYELPVGQKFKLNNRQGDNCPYTSNLTWEWKFKANGSIVIDVQSLGIEDSFGCSKDRLEIVGNVTKFDGSCGAALQALWRESGYWMCGQAWSLRIEVQNVLQIRFISDGDNEAEGFALVLSAENGNDSKGQQTTQSANIQQANEPQSPTPPTFVGQQQPSQQSPTPNILPGNQQAHGQQSPTPQIFVGNQQPAQQSPTPELIQNNQQPAEEHSPTPSFISGQQQPNQQSPTPDSLLGNQQPVEQQSPTPNIFLAQQQPVQPSPTPESLVVNQQPGQPASPTPNPIIAQQQPDQPSPTPNIRLENHQPLQREEHVLSAQHFENEHLARLGQPIPKRRRAAIQKGSQRHLLQAERKSNLSPIMDSAPPVSPTSDPGSSW